MWDGGVLLRSDDFGHRLERVELCVVQVALGNLPGDLAMSDQKEGLEAE